ncbi:phytanoyl-CoA dioxygenase, peroxisomal [Nasonia vitripennis]|uniref:phytanoyl-CoA dioxygenase n=1 Tax=Nasonia vitripennis TaxID=7425 RepID=A0A7M7Q1M3_NASVI|nr:phytanoyl-CoA dioxygenase, peroxisomal [Nasonia vitripennis]XP_008209765.1 phytanoyl-CoA dioxygenase, peroxisomal [Nasonia vitripennis]XP_008209797.1 phytanoyl-CoA dioxygenase, peroxisomal [Nasonia vitripennis]XP_016837620.1 phytanoyl-CoA dioxygenase, peroxisomal [Nasonia vitripennis]XP_031780442.1 phytanoyl-CoA dioxygenase, peroxisomal [Nasonia vitripennis]XP_031780443.1 phytanoyl-CoA dioxygenase, peroxisomal [Nasonia vitripennis]XP_031780444.1 phytanoyl-CoA dioxygenase, peroxisomal [Naso
MQSFTLTRDTGRLSHAQRVFYERNGFLVIPGLVPLDILQKCSRRFDDYATGKIPKGFTTVMRDVIDRKSVNKIQDILHDEVFLEYFRNKELLDVVETFTGPNILGVHSMLIAKPPDVGSGSSRHPPHQDLYYFPFRPANKIVAAWTAIEKCDKANGCLHVYPGSHLTYDLQPHGYPEGAVNKMYHGIQDLPESINWVDVEMEPGDTVFFHPLLIHGSWKNVSTRTRKAISCHYASADVEYIKVEGTVQQLIEEEVLEIFRRRFPSSSDINFIDIWKLRSMLMRGIQSSL